MTPDPRRMPLKQQTEGAMLAVVAAVVALASNIPVLGLFFHFLAPVPVALAAVRHGARLCLLSVGLGTVVMFLMAGPLQAAVFLLVFGGTGAVVGLLVRRRIRGAAMVVLGSVAMMVLTGLSLWGVSWLMGLPDPLVEIRRELAWSHEKMGQIMAGLPFPAAELERQQMASKQMLRIMDAMIAVPIFFLVAGGVTGFLTWYLVIAWALRRLGTEAEELPPFGGWRLPPLVAVLLLYPFFLPVPVGVELTDLPVHLNLVFLSGSAFWLVGMAAGWAWLDRRSVARPVRLPLMVMAGVFFQGAVMLLGLVDSVGGWRDPGSPVGSVADAASAGPAGPQPPASPGGTKGDR